MHASPPSAGPEEEAEPPEPPRVRRLRLMVSALTLASILGVLTVAGALVYRLSAGGGTGGGGSAPLGAEAIALPPGERIVAVGRSPGALTLATEDAEGVERLRGFDPATGEPTGVTLIRRETP
jgi:hypothetical protein